MKMVARMAVARVSRLAVPRPVMNPPMPWDEPIPNPPPSLRWISTTPISASVTNRWMMSRTLAMSAVFPGARGAFYAPAAGLESAPAARAMARKSAATRLAPPISAPPTSGKASSPAALPGLTDPP